MNKFIYIMPKSDYCFTKIIYERICSILANIASICMTLFTCWKSGFNCVLCLENFCFKLMFILDIFWQYILSKLQKKEENETKYSKINQDDEDIEKGNQLKNENEEKIGLLKRLKNGNREKVELFNDIKASNKKIENLLS